MNKHLHSVCFLVLGIGTGVALYLGIRQRTAVYDDAASKTLYAPQQNNLYPNGVLITAGTHMGPPKPPIIATDNQALEQGKASPRGTNYGSVVTNG